MAIYVKESSSCERLDCIFPIGSIYMSVNSTNPSTYFGGTWTAWGTGRVPVGIDSSQSEFNTVEKTGGSKEVQSHTHSVSLTSASSGSHTHTIPVQDKAGLNGTVTNKYIITTGSSNRLSGGAQAAGAHTHKVSGNTGSYGSGNSKNLPPYIVCYMWKRTA